MRRVKCWVCCEFSTQMSRIILLLYLAVCFLEQYLYLQKYCKSVLYVV